MRPLLPPAHLALGLTVVLFVTRFVLPAILGTAPAPLHGWPALLAVWIAVLLLARLLADQTDPASALCACAGILGASPLYAGLLAEHAARTAASFCLAVLLLLLSRKVSVVESLWGRIGLGSLAALAFAVERQNAALVLLAVGASLRGRPRGASQAWSLVQVLAPLLAAALILRSAEPWTLSAAFNPWLWVEVLFAERAGVVTAMPWAWAVLVGLGLLARREARSSALLAATGVTFLVLLVGRDPIEPRGEMAGLLPLAALAGAVLVQALAHITARRPWLPLVVGGGAFVVWNLLLMEQFRLVQIPRDDTVSFARTKELAAGRVARAVGNPLAWPANWLYRWRGGLPLPDFDRVVGSHTAHDLRSGAALLDLGDAESDQECLGSGWSAPIPCEGANCRVFERHATLWIALVWQHDVSVRVRAAGGSTLTLLVNGVATAHWPLGEELRDWEAPIASAQWRRPVTRVELAAEGKTQVDQITLVRMEGARP